MNNTFKYKTTGYNYIPNAEIIKVEIEKETNTSVWIKRRRCAKRTAYDCYFDTWEDAYAYILDLAQKVVISAQCRLDNAKDLLCNIKGRVKIK